MTLVLLVTAFLFLLESPPPNNSPAAFYSLPLLPFFPHDPLRPARPAQTSCSALAYEISTLPAASRRFAFRAWGWGWVGSERDLIAARPAAVAPALRPSPWMVDEGRQILQAAASGCQSRETRFASGCQRLQSAASGCIEVFHVCDSQTLTEAISRPSPKMSPEPQHVVVVPITQWSHEYYSVAGVVLSENKS